MVKKSLKKPTFLKFKQAKTAEKNKSFKLKLKKNFPFNLYYKCSKPLILLYQTLYLQLVQFKSTILCLKPFHLFSSDDKCFSSNDIYEVVNL